MKEHLRFCSTTALVQQAKRELEQQGRSLEQRGIHPLREGASRGCGRPNRRRARHQQQVLALRDISGGPQATKACRCKSKPSTRVLFRYRRQQLVMRVMLPILYHAQCQLYKVVEL
jgi:hypothetical protein